MENLIAKTKSGSKRHAKTQSQDPELPHKIKVVTYLVAQPEFHVFHVISPSGAGTIPYQKFSRWLFLRPLNNLSNNSMALRTFAALWVFGARFCQKC